MQYKKIIKKGGLTVATLGVIVAGAAMFSAFEAHVINVTARIENALKVDTKSIEFGTVFPQEYLTSDIEVGLSDSFKGEDRVDDVEYVIKQKPKVKAPCVLQETAGNFGNLFGLIKTANAQELCNPNDPNKNPQPGDPYATVEVQGSHTPGPQPAWQYCEENLPPDSDLTDNIGYTVDLSDPYWIHCYLPLANDLSKHELTTDGTEEENDKSVDAFHEAYLWGPDGSSLNPGFIATGRLAKSVGDNDDTWQIDLKVPCFVNHCAQEASNPQNGVDDDIPGFYVPDEFRLDPATEHKVFGTDLWIEVTEISLCRTVECEPTPQPPTLTVTKVLINTGGGTAVVTDFSYTVNAGASTPFEADGTNSGVVAPGNYTIVEDAESGYTTTYANSLNGNSDCNSLAVPATGNVTCTVTNTFIVPDTGTLTVTKVIDNSDGIGSKVFTDFSYTVNAGASTPFEADGTNSSVVAPGNYTVVEDAETGYTTTYANSLNANADCNALAVPSAGNVTCTITNTAIFATLTVNKIVIVNDGGNETVANFALSVNNGVGSVTDEVPKKVAPGSYKVSEIGVSGYDATFDGIVCDEDGDVTLAAGESKTCTLTNDDIKPNITLHKVVVGGPQAGNPGAFTMRIDGISVSNGSSKLVTANAAHTITEDAVAGYTGAMSGDIQCPGVLGGSATLDEGQAINCTITNTFTGI